MKLFLASDAGNPETLDRLGKELHGFRGRKIVYIPTASNGVFDWGFWKIKRDGTWKLVNNLGAEVKAVQLEDYKNNLVTKELEGQDVIWFAGGAAGYLAYWIRRCSLDIYMDSLLGKNTWYVGSSAGSMVAGETLQVATWDFVDAERGAENIEPMHLVDFDIFPHFEDAQLNKIKKNYTGSKLYLLKDGEEIIVKDDKITVVGEERVIEKCLPRS